MHLSENYYTFCVLILALALPLVIMAKQGVLNLERKFILRVLKVWWRLKFNRIKGYGVKYLMPGSLAVEKISFLSSANLEKSVSSTIFLGIQNIIQSSLAHILFPSD